ncbi:hypothetical protein B9X71_00505 [Acinetobacter baumannii]|uniref:hypothetical protein n=1 Tax=Acinetobacter baumannii TaxID=470 RepID=UPI000A33FC10|nr:hypothetical protein [Acinetobacter baumannii]MCT9166646.1 hypothetical protein [Acinetobacter baumannii]MCT9173880.1 hypothetical protein [Acinetobacter baumannii]MCT9179705.1 hypothetical protein [Acinetobacter baumannii]OTK52169.1 hypothetical protein B9X71_00505 [Acinetobacter baumannii]
MTNHSDFLVKLNISDIKKLAGSFKVLFDTAAYSLNENMLPFEVFEFPSYQQIIEILAKKIGYNSFNSLKSDERKYFILDLNRLVPEDFINISKNKIMFYNFNNELFPKIVLECKYTREIQKEVFTNVLNKVINEIKSYFPNNFINLKYISSLQFDSNLKVFFSGFFWCESYLTSKKGNFEKKPLSLMAVMLTIFSNKNKAVKVVDDFNPFFRFLNFCDKKIVFDIDKIFKIKMNEFERNNLKIFLDILFSNFDYFKKEFFTIEFDFTSYIGNCEFITLEEKVKNIENELNFKSNGNKYFTLIDIFVLNNFNKIENKILFFKDAEIKKVIDLNKLITHYIIKTNSIYDFEHELIHEFDTNEGMSKLVQLAIAQMNLEYYFISLGSEKELKQWFFVNEENFKEDEVWDFCNDYLDMEHWESNVELKKILLSNEPNYEKYINIIRESYK